MRLKSRITFALFTISLFIPSIVYSNILQGRLDGFGPFGKQPITHIRVTLHAKDSSEALKGECITNFDGEYYIDNIQPGTYILKIWSANADNKSSDFEVTVKDKPITNIKPILIHTFQINFPKENEKFRKGSVVKIKGNHSMPVDVFIWLLLKNRKGYYYVPNNKPLKMESDGAWKSGRIYIGEGTTSILAILLTIKKDKEFRNRIPIDGIRIPTLPEGVILAERKIDVL